MTKHYFATDGSYGTADWLGTFDTDNWDDSDWSRIEDAYDDERLEVAENIDEYRHAEWVSQYKHTSKDLTNIGVSADIRYEDDPLNVATCYLSFGKYDEATDRDSFGLRDDFIFYYLDKDEQLSLLTAVVRKEKAWALEGVEWFIDLRNEPCLNYSNGAF